MDRIPLPQVRPRWDLVASAAVYLGALAVGGLLFFRWLYRQSRPADGAAGTAAWRWRWTFAGLALVLLMFASGTAMIGITHQVTWLVRSPDPLYRRGGHGEANRIKCASNLGQIGQALQVYANENAGRLPDGLRQLMLNEDVTRAVFICPASNDTFGTGTTLAEQADDLVKPGHCSYVYLGKGLPGPGDPRRVLAVEPLENHDGRGMNVLRADGSVEWLERAEAEKLLPELGFERVELKAR